MRNHEDVGGQTLSRTSDERPLSSALDVPGEKDTPAGAFDPDHARVSVVESRLFTEWVQNFERDPVPVPPAARRAFDVGIM